MSYLSHMKKAICFSLVASPFLFPGLSHAEDRTIRNFCLDSSNALVVRFHSKLLPKPVVIQPPPPLVPGLHDIVLLKDKTQTFFLVIQSQPPPPPGYVYARVGGGVPISWEEQTFDIVLVKDKTENLLNSLVQRDDPSVGKGIYDSGDFYFFDAIVSGDTVHYVYFCHREICVVQLRKVNDAFRTIKETSLPCERFPDLREILLYESPAHEFILHMGKKNYKENASGDFIETGTIDPNEIHDAYRNKQERERIERKNEPH